jgi:hypothetical protein
MTHVQQRKNNFQQIIIVSQPWKPQTPKRRYNCSQMITAWHRTNREPRSSKYLRGILRLHNSDNRNMFKRERDRVLAQKNTGPNLNAMSVAAVFDTGGKPSTWFPPRGLAEQLFVTRIQCMLCGHSTPARTHTHTHTRARTRTSTRACEFAQERKWTYARAHTRTNLKTHFKKNHKKRLWDKNHKKN